MPPRDYDAAPLSEELGLGKIVAGLANDLDELRAGKISVNDAVARSLLAKQIFNGVRLYLNGTKLLAGRAQQIDRQTTGASLGEPQNPKADNGEGK